MSGQDMRKLMESLTFIKEESVINEDRERLEAYNNPISKDKVTVEELENLMIPKFRLASVTYNNEMYNYSGWKIINYNIKEGVYMTFTTKNYHQPDIVLYRGTSIEQAVIAYNFIDKNIGKHLDEKEWIDNTARSLKNDKW